ncbi:maleate cis-trans isomerase family protein [Sphingomonas sanxanigenens]|uniref:Asp/Glu racemase n=1 Tax=Sphingomonas sanxanigenens DSM 19645 = NX02 TaxID=1123269 RepID=W0AFJ8_9SPHN|nr:hypothetical protein [Sphingomonas sanxanigenens]AHE54445.1 hypothetical protein NX02_13760 [Sphingomonas sanxanigenens DSM 19645 = NX02]
MIGGYDYGRAGRIGVGTPQANPTVEAELRILMPPAVSLTVLRLTSNAAAPADRLRAYLLGLCEQLTAFDSFRPDVFGFGCTASAYLVDSGDERAVLNFCEDRYGYPIVTAADAIDLALSRIGARRIALLSPYPPELAVAAIRYWRGRGYEVAATGTAGDLGPTGDTRGIYALGSADAGAALARADLAGVDAVLLSGTGMPSLPLIADADLGVPLLSSNLCLAAALCARLGLGDPIDPASAPGQAWRERCRAATAIAGRE